MTDGTALDRWVDGIRQGSPPAFDAVHRLMADDLLSFANGMLRDRRSAEDAVQQAFLELVRHGRSIRGDGRSLRGWLFRAVRYSCLDELRRRRRRPEVPTDRLPDMGAVESLPEGIDPALERALGGLSDRQRVLVALRHVVGLSGEEIAAVLRTNRTAVYAALGRAERRLRSLLTEEATR